MIRLLCCKGVIHFPNPFMRKEPTLGFRMSNVEEIKIIKQSINQSIMKENPFRPPITKAKYQILVDKA
jgi:hypothetical protein